MAKLQRAYEGVKFVSVKVGVTGKVKDARDAMLGCIGTLKLYESEHKEPGKHYIKFSVLLGEDEMYIRTSLGTLREYDGLLSIRTHEGANVYVFDISEAHQLSLEELK